MLFSFSEIDEVTFDCSEPGYSILNAEICIDRVWVDENESLLRQWMLDPTYRCHHHELHHGGESGSIEIIHFNGDQPRDASRAFVELCRHADCRRSGWKPLFREEEWTDSLIADLREEVFNHDIDSARSSQQATRKLVDDAVMQVEYGIGSDSYDYFRNGHYRDERPVAMEKALKSVSWGAALSVHRWNQINFMGHGALGWFLFDWGTGA